MTALPPITTTSPTATPAPTGATPLDVATAIATTTAPAADLTPGIAPVGRQYGKVISIQTATPPTLTITLAGSTVPIVGVRYVTGYSPNVSDTVLVDHVGTDVIVSGSLAGASGSGGGPVPVGSMICCPVALTDPAWLLCDGSSFSATAYPRLSAFLGGTTLPDMRGQLPMGAGGPVSLGGTAGSTNANGLVSHTHSGDAHTHSHTHSGGSHSHSGDPHSHTIGFQNTGLVAAGGFQVITPGGSSGTSNNSGTTGSAAVSVGSDATGSSIGTTGSSGSGSSFSVLNPVRGVNWLIRCL